MTIPCLPGWLIDFETAQNIFDAQNNARIVQCQKLCSSGVLHICHSEEKLFKEHAALRAPFLEDQNCICYPTAEIWAQCANVSNSPKCAKLVPGNQSAIYLTAIASCRQYGLISDNRSIFFTTVYDLCTHFGVPAFSADEFFI